MVKEITIARHCAEFERNTSMLVFPHGFNRSEAQRSLSVLGEGALKELSEYLQTRKAFDSQTVEERVQRSWCALFSKIQQQDGLPQPEHAQDNFKAWVKWLEDL